MTGTDDREELKRRLDQARRLLAAAGDALTRQRLRELVRDLEQQLRSKN